jgi:hypothetical protein
VLDWAGASDELRDLTGQDALEVYDAANGTAGKVLWNVHDLLAQVPENC